MPGCLSMLIPKLVEVLMTRRLERLLTIDSLIRNPERQTQQSLAAALEVSDRTIRDDLAWLRDRFHAPLEFSHGQGYYYSDTDWRLPTIPLTQGELFALTLGARMLEAYSGSAYEAELRSAVGRLAERLPEESWVHFILLSYSQNASNVETKHAYTKIRSLLPQLGITKTTRQILRTSRAFAFEVFDFSCPSNYTES